MKFKLLNYLLVICCALTSCVKDELTLPAEVEFKFGMLSYLNKDSNLETSAERYYSIDKGTLIIDAIEFDGIRRDGKDVYFISDFPFPLVANLKDQKTNFDVRFDIPQGVYDRIDISLYLSNSRTSPLLLEGRMKTSELTQTPVRFEYNFTEQLNIRTIAKSAQTIVLRKDKLSVAMVTVDAEALFRLTNYLTLNSAEISMVDKTNVLLISEQNNTSIFSQLANRINNAFTVSFE